MSQQHRNVDFLGLVRRLSALPGQGPAAEWRDDLGRDIINSLRASRDPVALVEAYIACKSWRPTPADLHELEADLGRTGHDTGRVGGCPDCDFGGYRMCRTLRMLGGQLVTRETAVACSCDRGEKIAMGGAISASAAILHLSREREHSSADRHGHVDGLVAFGVSDRRMRQWPLELYVDPQAEEELRRRGRMRIPGLARDAWDEPDRRAV